MAHWLASQGDGGTLGQVKRLDPLYRTVNFPRPMMAGLVSEGPHGLRADCVFYRKDDLAGLIWEAADGHDHPLLSHETSRDFRGCVLKFDGAAEGLLGLDAVHGPTLTIEGRDAAGAAKSWFVRLWNYAAGRARAQCRGRIAKSRLHGRADRGQRRLGTEPTIAVVQLGRSRGRGLRS